MDLSLVPNEVVEKPPPILLQYPHVNKADRHGELRHIDMSPRLLPVDLQAQLVPASFAHAVHHLVDQLDLSAFDGHYRHDDCGSPPQNGWAPRRLRHGPSCR